MLFHSNGGVLMPKKIKSVPVAGKTITALSQFGYTLESSICDIIDNSISRGFADNIDVIFSSKTTDAGKKINKDFFILIADDGIGMSEPTLKEAMRFGSQTEDYSNSDLSKFGMGLKTASLSQSRRFTVISKSKKSSKVSAYVFDYNEKTRLNSWDIDELYDKEIDKLLRQIHQWTNSNIEVKYTQKDSFTFVLWENLFEFNNSLIKTESPVLIDNIHKMKLSDLRHYIGTVYSRFIFNQKGAKKTVFALNYKDIKGVDPVFQTHPNTKVINLSDDSRFSLEDGLEPILINAYVIPCSPNTKLGMNAPCFATEQEYRSSKSPGKSLNDSQGYYIYRNNRLINWGGWYRTKSSDEHDKLARATIDLSSEHDDYFTLDVKKTTIRVGLQRAFKAHLEKNINPKLIRAAKKRYGGKDEGELVVKNKFRSKKKIVPLLTKELFKSKEIKVEPIFEKGQRFLSDVKKVKIKNEYGTFIKSKSSSIKDLSNFVTRSEDFGNDEEFWRMEADVDNMIILINKAHPFYKYVYEKNLNDPKITALVDAFLYTLCFAEISCISNNNSYLFSQIREVASKALKEIINRKFI